MSLWLAIPFGVGPCLFWLWLVERHDDHEREPWLLIVLAAALGALSTFGVLWLRPWLEQLFAPDSPALDAFVVTALGEEVWKLAALVPLLCMRELDEPMDGIVYGAAAGLGFAAIENIYYAQHGGDVELLLQRAFTATLQHAACTGCLGFCWAQGKLRRLGRGKLAWLLGGVVLAVALHGSYDLFLDGDRARALVSLLLVLPVALLLFALKIRWARSRSSHYHPEP